MTRLSAKTPDGGQYRELNYINGFCCLLVMLIHVLSIGISSLDVTSWQYMLIFFPWKLAACAFPAFLFTGGVKMGLMFERESHVSYGRYILRRVEKIYLPYVIFTLIYCAVFVKIGYLEPQSAVDVLGYIVRGDVSAPFYYIVALMQLYLLMPLWRRISDRVPWYIGVPAAAFITLLFENLDGILAVFGVEGFAYTSQLFPSHLVYWLAGIYAGRNYASVRAALKKSFAWEYLCFPILLFASLSFFGAEGLMFVYNAGAFKIFFALSSIALLLALFIRLEDSSLERTRRLFSGLHAASFTVYLSHCLFMETATNFLRGHGVTDMAALLAYRALVCLTAPFLLYLLIHLAWRLIKRAKKKGL